MIRHHANLLKQEQLLIKAGTTYPHTWDGRGNLIDDGKRSYTWSRANGLIADGDGRQYAYDARGWRCREISIETSKTMEVTADGEVLTETPLKCRVIRACLSVYAPALPGSGRTAT